MEIVEKLSKRIDTLGKVYIKEQPDLSPFGFTVEKVEPQVNVITHTIATMPVAYNVNDYDGEKGQTALNFVKTTVKSAIEKEDEIVGIATTVHTDLINQLATTDDETDRLASTIVNSLVKGQTALRTKKVMDTLATIKKSIVLGEINLTYLYNIIKNPKHFIEHNSDMFPSVYNQSDIVVIARADKVNRLAPLDKSNNITSIIPNDLPKVIIMPNEYFKDRTYAYIISKDALKVYEKYLTIEPQVNAKYGFTNYFLRTKATIFLSPFELAVKVNEA